MAEFDVRYLLLAPANIFLRHHVCLFFTDYITSPLTLFKVALLCIFSVIFLFTSFHFPAANNTLLLPQHGHRHRLGLGSRRLRTGYSEWSALLTIHYIFTLVCPTLVFLYVHPVLIFSSMSPTNSLNLLTNLYRRLQAALSAFIAFDPNPVHVADAEADATPQLDLEEPHLHSPV